MKMFLAICGILAILAGFATFLGANGAIQESVAGLILVVGFVSFSSAAIIEELQRARKASLAATELSQQTLQGILASSNRTNQLLEWLGAIQQQPRKEDANVHERSA